MKISLIIPTYNEEKVIDLCLESLAKQTYSDFEIILIDDGSVDNSKVKIQKAKLQFKNQKLILLEQNHGGPGIARNLGAKKAAGEILVFVDADMTFAKDFLKKLVQPILDSKSKGTFSKDEYVENWDNVWARCWNINEGWPPKMRHPKNYPDHQPVFRAILKSEFDRVGGFTPGGYNDDWSLGQKLGYDAENAPGAVFYHANPSSLKEVYAQAKWVGRREYKLGVLGTFFALLRALFPVSLIIGFAKFVIYGEPAFVIFKVVYDWGIFVGIIESLQGNQLK